MSDIEHIKSLVDTAHKILIIQADNPDADSLASSLALEQILHDLGKDPLLYCAVDMPAYLKYLPGWDRVNNTVPHDIDMSFIVDTSTMTLLEQLTKSGSINFVSSKPVIVLDHHAESTSDITFAAVTMNDTGKVSTGEVIYEIATQLTWPVSITAAEHIATSILADSLGLSTDNTTAQTYRVMASLIEAGVNRPKLEELRRSYNKMPLSIMRYKGALLERTEIHNDSTALLIIPQDEINEFSPLYNPAPLIQPDHLQTEGVRISIVLKSYDSGRITGAIRANHDSPIASLLAKEFGGGGHLYAAGFKIENAVAATVRSQVIEKTRQLLEDIE
jgi:phosphoesterase RecJ-like protein